jgi:glycosyltransferase involved in cell wall biosynthesis
VSTLEPRKNIKTLVKAFEILKQQYKIPHHLILIGKKGWKYTAILETIESSPVQNCIHQLDYLDDRQLVQFYQQATAFLYPSYYEGFGLPVLEAMTLGIPVITSNQSSLPEVTGDAALLVHPEDVDSLVSATRSVIDNPDLHRHLSQAGRERSLLFSWKKTALQTLAAYKSLL